MRLDGRDAPRRPTVQILGVDAEDENALGERVEAVVGSDLGEVLSFANKQVAKGWRVLLENVAVNTYPMPTDSMLGSGSHMMYIVFIRFSRRGPPFKPDAVAEAIADGLVGRGVVLDKETAAMVASEISRDVWKLWDPKPPWEK